MKNSRIILTAAAFAAIPTLAIAQMSRTRNHAASRDRDRADVVDRDRRRNADGRYSLGCG